MRRLDAVAAAVACAIIGMSLSTAMARLDGPPILNGGITPFVCGTSGGIAWSNGGTVLACGPAITDAAGNVTVPATSGLAITSASSNQGVKWMQNGGAFRAKISDGSADAVVQGLTITSTGGLFISSGSNGVNCTVGTLNPTTAIVQGGIVIHC